MSSLALCTLGPPNLSLRPCELELLGSLPLDAKGPAAWGSLLGPALSLVLPVVYALICGCGVMANGLVISIVLSCKHKLVSDVYILNLAMADLLFLVRAKGLENKGIREQFWSIAQGLRDTFIINQLVQERGWIFRDFLCRAVTTIDLNNQFTSVAIVAMLCVDRPNDFTQPPCNPHQTGWSCSDHLLAALEANDPSHAAGPGSPRGHPSQAQLPGAQASPSKDMAGVKVPSPL
ncbi:Neuropeptides B/W receptor type 2 [Chelonia mydas]|uniref:Neuropeptides B/W receptor type 2 n=1 Tax=Chelonia mydas TaxID=8469 RepID=M7B3G3_CHEMY|nr:Neuropeptides B/W receptor type 2 [Chelonia mydas]